MSARTPLRGINVAIDGPASSGKGTVAREVARVLGYTWVDTGSMYRAVSLAALRRDVPWELAEVVADLSRHLHFAWIDEGDHLQLILDGEDVTEAVRDELVGRGASVVAAHPGVRAVLLEQQRGLGAPGGVVMDGRDIGTVVLPDAALKVFLDASLDERARRRSLQFPHRDPAVIRADIAARDARDSGRAVAPLRAAEDAVHIDTTGRSVGDVVGEVVGLARARGA